MAGTQSTFEQLMERLEPAALLGATGEHLESIARTSAPAKAQPGMAKKIALIRKLGHEQWTDPAVGDALREAAAGEALSMEERWIVDRLLFVYNRVSALPAEFVGRRAEATAQAEVAWAKARKANDFALFAPYLSTVLGLVREEAILYGGDPDVPGSLYSQLLARFEPDMTIERLKPIVQSVRERLVPLLGMIMGIGKWASNDLLRGEFPIPVQEGLKAEYIPVVGIDPDGVQFALTAHPFCGTVGPDHVMIGYRLYENDLSPLLFAIAHEMGHGLFEQSADPRVKTTIPIPGMIFSLALHESQSRFWECIVGRSRPFWDIFFEKVQRAFPGSAIASADAGTFYRHVNCVRPSFIRVEADEVTYNLHILLRTEIEMGLLDGTISVADLPRVFGDKMEKYLGIRPATDAQGVLQDVHWSAGLLGYFPTYMLGNFAAAQLFAAYRKEHADWGDRFAAGDFGTLTQWLQERVHAFGHVSTLDGVLQAATGEPLNLDHWFTYIHNKFLG